MNPVVFAMWVLAGLIAGWTANKVMKDGGHGLKGDMILGVVGSVVGSWVFRTLGDSSEAGTGVLVIVAFVGAALGIVAQRGVWPGPGR